MLTFPSPGTCFKSKDLLLYITLEELNLEAPISGEPIWTEGETISLRYTMNSGIFHHDRVEKMCVTSHKTSQYMRLVPWRRQRTLREKDLKWDTYS